METNAIYKGRLFLSDLTESGFKISRQALTLVHFEYNLNHVHDGNGVVESSILGDVSFVVRLGEMSNADIFLSHLQSLQTQSYTFLFDDVVSSGEVTDFRSGLVVTGYVYDVDEDYTGETLLTVRIKPLTFKFLGDNTSVELDIYND
ncbi:MAG: hypothetical protein MJY56_06610 [Bacteroidales bacterium]|nr:hypothetical protein [Bacteroidales bacterium]